MRQASSSFTIISATSTLYLLLLIMASGSVAFSSPSSSSEQPKPITTSYKRAKVSHYYTELHASIGSNSTADGDDNNNNAAATPAGKLEELKQKEAELSKLLAAVRREKLTAIRSRPLTIGVMGFGRFGQFIARTFQKYGRVVVTSRSDYTDIANGMGVTYVPLSTLDAFLEQDLDVIVVATSILSFESTIQSLVPHLKADLQRRANKGDIVKGPLIVDVLSVKEHARQTMLELLPVECDILCTHPMFGPDSGKKGWHGLNFVYEKTRIDGVVLEPPSDTTTDIASNNNNNNKEAFVDSAGQIHNVHEDSEGHVEAMDRMERFLSIWEEEGCRMVPMSAKDHDTYAANSQFITHLMGRILGSQGLAPTPIDTKGFESVLKLVGSTTADSFELFYGLYKFNQNSLDTIVQLRSAMDEVVDKLQVMEEEEQQKNNKRSVPS